MNYLQCKDVPAERLYEGSDIFINVIPILYEDALMVQEIKNEPPSRSVSDTRRAPSTPSLREASPTRTVSVTRRNKKLRDLAQLHKETVLIIRT